MSVVKSIKSQLGLSLTATNNFNFDASAADGTLKLGRGNAGATTDEILRITSGGNIQISGSSKYITGDFSTLATRVKLQTNTANGQTVFELVPNGTSTQTAIVLGTSSDFNNTNLLSINAYTTDVRFTSSMRGTGTVAPITFHIGGERVRITSDGFVGIGTSSPTTPLYIKSSTTNAAGSPAITISGSSNTERINIFSNTQPVVSGHTCQGTVESPTAVVAGNILMDVQGRGYDGTSYGLGARMVFQADGTWSASSHATAIVFSTVASGETSFNERIRIDSYGKLAINNTLPQRQLHITSNTAAVGHTQIMLEGAEAGYGAGITFQSKLTNTSTLVEMARITADGESSWNSTISNQNAGLRFYTTGTGVSSYQMRLDCSGHLCGGRVDGPISNKPNGTVGWSLEYWTDQVMLALGTSRTVATDLVRFRTPNGTVGSISTSGSATTYATSSDYRLKENIQPMQNALAVVKQLNPVTYNWKADGSDGQGFIAHELQAVVPDAVTGEKDATEIVDVKDGEGNIIGQEERPVYQGIDTSFLVATLTKAIQEQQAIIESLEARLAKAGL